MRVPVRTRRRQLFVCGVIITARHRLLGSSKCTGVRSKSLVARPGCRPGKGSLLESGFHALNHGTAHVSYIAPPPRQACQNWMSVTSTRLGMPSEPLA